MKGRGGRGFSLTRTIDRFVPPQLRRGGLGRFRRARLIVGFSWLAMFWCVIFGILFLTVFGLPLAAGLSLGGAVLLMGAPPLLRVSSPTVAGNFLVLVLFGLLTTLSWYLGGFSAPLLVWYAFLPALATVVTNTGLLWGAVVIAQLLGLYLMDVLQVAPPARLATQELNALAITSLIAFVALLVTLTMLYEGFETQTLRRLRRANRQLAATRDEAVAASLAKSSFLANISHEFRTPLNAIIGYSDMLLEEGQPPEHLVGDLQRIRASGSNLLRMVNELLDLSKIEAGKMEVELESFRVATLVEDLLASVRPQAARNGNRLVVEGTEEVGSLRSDPTKLRHCLLNLLSNACKFTENGSITLSVSRAARQVSFQVQDTGIGMAPQELDRIFIPFTQADASISRRFGGTGLGLTICERLIRLLGGSVAVTSHPGQGSCFTLTVPDATAAGEGPP